MSSGAVELVMPEALDGRAVLAALAERLTLEVDRPATSDRVLLDTFDARLRAAGLTAEWPAGRAARRRLTLREPGMPPRSADVAVGPALPLAAVPPGPVRDRLAPVIEERALISVARVRSRVLRAAVLNGDDKTVVRLAVEQPVVDGHELPARLLVEPVRGYERDFDRVVGRLRDGLGLEPADVPLFDAAVTAAGGRPEGVQTKPEFELARGTRSDAAAGVVLRPLADIAEANVEGVLDDLDTEFLHDLRVSVRRARSVLRELKGVHSEVPRARLRRELKWVQAVTGPLRDLDVQLLEWDEVAGGRTDELAPLRALLEQRRTRELVRVRRALRSRRFAAALEAWRALA
jgi:CHAD domain